MKQQVFVLGKRFIPVCHHCGEHGHIRPNCRKFNFSNSNRSLVSLQKQLTEQMKMITELKGCFAHSLKNRVTKHNPRQMNNPVWVKKESKLHSHDATCLVAFTALISKCTDTWYFDSGCSRHMTGNKSWFVSFNNEITTGEVTFGDAKRAAILARGTVKVPGMPELKNVLLVDRLTVNLISISQLTNDFEGVWFNKDRCLVLNEEGETMMHGEKTLDNCYHMPRNDVKINTSTPDSTRKEKQISVPYKVVNNEPVSPVCELSPLDLMESIRYACSDSKVDNLIVINNVFCDTESRHMKDESVIFKLFETLREHVLPEKLGHQLQSTKDSSVNWTELKRLIFETVFARREIFHKFSSSSMCPKNDMIKKKNHVLIRLTSDMLLNTDECSSGLPDLNYISCLKESLGKSDSQSNKGMSKILC